MRKGFTLIELLVVIAVFGVLAAGVFTAINPLQRIRQARDAQRKMDLSQIKNALETYAVSHQGQYPVTEWINSTNPNFLKELVDDGDLKKIPVDPLNSGCSSANANPRDGGASCYTYAYYSAGWCGLNGSPYNYILTTKLEAYDKSDLSQKPYNNPDGSLCQNWSEGPVNGLYVLSTGN